MSALSTLKKKWRGEHEFRNASDDLRPEFAIARQFIAARKRAGLSQAVVASRMGTTQSAVARLESGSRLPAMRSLQRYAAAIGCRVDVRLKPATPAQARPRLGQ
jgi:transcriptional regulator with XRE-family HTH domain